jgi:signal transduction histidine kinase
MGEMISMIAHQWRQPLGAISASALGIKTKIKMQKFDLSTQEGQDTQEQYLLHKLENINNYVEHLSDTIEDFRNFFKPHTGKSDVNLQHTIEKALNIIQPALVEGNIKIQQDVYFSRTLHTYDNELLQALLNIIKNAVDNFILKKTDSPTIYIQGYIQQKEFVIEIADNGGGINKSILEKIFDPYFSTKSDQNGTGIGLYMTKTIIEDHCDGHIEASNTDKGALFSITLH